MQLIGAFSKIITLNNLPMKGAINDNLLEIIENAGVLVANGKIIEIDNFEKLVKKYAHQTSPKVHIQEVPPNLTLMPAFIDAHTHICFGGNRSADYALRIAGTPYLEIAKSGGGIMDTVRKTRACSDEELLKTLLERTERMFSEGVMTAEVKSGYGLSVAHELRMLEIINNANEHTNIDLVATCLAAHVCPPEHTPQEYLHLIEKELLPQILAKNLSKRVDVFVEETAFNAQISKQYLLNAQKMGFDITIHADQFSTAGSKLAVEVGAISADHLEATKEAEIKLLANSNTVAVVLPGASFGLGMTFAPARKLLDAGCILAIASDWNPGSAPLGDLLMQAAILGASEKLNTTETFAAITFRAAKALNINDKGILKEGMIADMIAFDTADYREILYWQGKMKPRFFWKNGRLK